MKKTEIIILIIILLSFVLSISFYSQMPERMASHWNFQGEVNGYMAKSWGLFLMPIFSIGLFLLFILIPKIDPLKKNIEKFRKYYDQFIVLIIGFMFYIYLLTLFWNVGIRFNMGQVITPATGILFYYAGILMEKAKRNWFIGIRTPWTLSSDNVWDKTHKMTGKLFKVIALIMFLGIFFPNYIIFIIIIPIVSVSFYAIVYSYFEYKKETEVL